MNPDIIFAVDCSCSIELDEEYLQLIYQQYQYFSALGICKMVLFDVKASTTFMPLSYDEFRNAVFEHSSRGGTDLQITLTTAAALDVKRMVVVTDGYMAIPEWTYPPERILWFVPKEPRCRNSEFFQDLPNVYHQL